MVCVCIIVIVIIVIITIKVTDVSRRNLGLTCFYDTMCERGTGPELVWSGIIPVLTPFIDLLASNTRPQRLENHVRSPNGAAAVLFHQSSVNNDSH